MVTITATNSITTTTPATIAPTLPSIEPLKVEVLVDDGVVVEVILAFGLVDMVVGAEVAVVLVLASISPLVEEVLAVEVVALVSVAMVVLIVGIVVVVVVLTVEVAALVSVAVVVLSVGIVAALVLVAMVAILVGIAVPVAVVVLLGISTACSSTI